MFNLAFHADSKAKAKKQLRDEAKKSDKDTLTAPLEKALELFLDAMPEAEGQILVSVSSDIPLGGYSNSLRVEVAFNSPEK